jgi:hypothetical protein
MNAEKGCTKVCKKCYISKPYSEYSKESKVKDGYRASCKKCCKLIKQEYYKNNKEKYKEAYNKFIERNPDYQNKYYSERKILY